MLVLKGHVVAGDIQNSPVVDRHAVRVAAKIFEYPVRTAERRFAVDHPLDLSERVGQLGKRGGFPQRGDCAGKAQEVFPESVFGRFKEEPPEQP